MRNAPCVGTLQNTMGRFMSPSKAPLRTGIRTPSDTVASWTQTSFPPKRHGHINQFSRFCIAHPCQHMHTHTDTQTTLRATTVYSNVHIYALNACSLKLSCVVFSSGEHAVAVTYNFFITMQVRTWYTLKSGMATGP